MISLSARLRAPLAHLRSPMAFTLGTRVALLLAGFLNAVVAARWYGATAAAQIGLMGSLLALTAVVSLAGSEFFVLKGLAGELDPKAPTFSSAVFRTLVFATGVVVVISLANQFGFGEIVRSTLTPQVALSLPLIVPANALRVLLYECIRSRELLWEYNLLTAIYPLTALVALISYDFILDGLSFSWVLVAGEVVGLIGASLVLLTRQSDLHLLRVSISDLVDYTNQSRSFFVSTLSIAALQSDVLIVGLLLPADQLGVYVVATRFAQVVRLPLTASGIGFAPKVAAVFRKSGAEDALALARKQSLIVFPISLTLALLLLTLGPFVLGFLGEEFGQSYVVMLVLISAELVLAFAGQAGLLLAMTGFERHQQQIFIASAVVLICAATVLASEFGAQGGAMAMLCAAGVRSLLGWRAVQKRFDDGVSIWHAVAQQRVAS